MNSYSQIKIDGQSNSTYKKLRCLFGQGSYPYSVEQGRVMNRTTTGRLSKQVGPSFKYWYGSFRVKVQEDTGYATILDLAKWHASNLPTNQRLVLRPHTWTGTAANHVTHVFTTVWTLTFSDDLDWNLVVGQSVTVSDGSVFTIASIVSTQQVNPVSVTATVASGSPVSSSTVYTCNITGDGVCEYNVTFTTGLDPQGQLPVMESSGGFAIVPFRLEER